MAAQASFCHSHGWMKIGALQLVGVQLLAEVPEVVLQSAFCSGGDGGGEAIHEAVPAFDWSGFQRHVVHMKLPLLTIIGSKGWAACAYVDVETANKTGEAVAVFSGVKDHAAFLTSTVKRASEAAAALGIVEGMKGAEALSLLR